MLRRELLVGWLPLAVAGARAATTEKKLDESMLASATWGGTPRVGIVLSNFKGGQEHDGTPIKGLVDPQPVDAALTQPQIDAIVAKVTTLGAQGRRGLDRAVGPEDWAVLKVRLAVHAGQTTDPRIVRSVIDLLAGAGRGKRLTIAEALPAGLDWDHRWTEFGNVSYRDVVDTAARKYRRIRIELVDLAQDRYLEVPVNMRTYAAGNPDGIYAIAGTIRECDKLISIAPLATDTTFGTAGAIANYRTIASPRLYGAGREKLANLGNAEDVMTDLYLHHPASYAIVGGCFGAEADSNAPKTTHHNVLVAGANALSVDAVASAVMGFDARTLPLLDKMELRGFGVRDPDSIWTRGNEIEQALRKFQKPPSWEKKS
ncbi:MAG: DUF362 domain-containing protein [Bryobacterales bacterium]|nr:DUF362 domain-containing protein [Bryobacterales bacterium]